MGEINFIMADQASITNDFSSPTLSGAGHIKAKYKYEVVIRYSSDKQISPVKVKRLEEVILKFDKELQAIAKQ